MRLSLTALGGLLVAIAVLLIGIGSAGQAIIEVLGILGIVCFGAELALSRQRAL